MPYRVLFVGAIDGKVRTRVPDRDGHFEQPGLHHLVPCRGRTHQACTRDRQQRDQRRRQGRRDPLVGELPDLKFDCIAWLGPTNDDNKQQTASLVSQFTRKRGTDPEAGRSCRCPPGLRTPNSRGISKIPGDQFLCERQPGEPEVRPRHRSKNVPRRLTCKWRKDHFIQLPVRCYDAQPLDVKQLANQREVRGRNLTHAHVEQEGPLGDGRRRAPTQQEGNRRSPSSSMRAAHDVAGTRVESPLNVAR